MTHNTKLLFSDKELLHTRFLETDLGKLYLAIPFEELAKHIPPPAHSQSGMGCKPWFDVKGGIALMFLKHNLCMSDGMLIDRINTDWSMQLFCGISLKATERILDKNLPSTWRTYLGNHLEIASFQKVLASNWKPYMQDTQIGTQDATCYESYITYPTDIKLIWNCCEKLYQLIQIKRKHLKLRKSRSNYKKHTILFTNFQKKRKKTRRQEKKLRKKLLKFLFRLMEGYSSMNHKHNIRLSNTKMKMLDTIQKVYLQQHKKAYGEKGTIIEDRIVSLSKPYIRPIVRGKEVKPVEFGAKVNKLLVDGIGFIEHISYNAFNESTHYQNGIYLQRKLFGKCTHHSADAIYATNKNRKYSTAQKIQTNFIPKGKQKLEYKSQADQMRVILNKYRSTVLEGSFGNEKNHYLLNRIKAKNKKTETCWIFFGMMTANASIIATRIEEKQKLARAA
jgi:transposase, IS5 family